MGCAAQLAKYEDSPQQSPQLIRVREGNSSRDPRVLDGVLLKQISDDPEKTAGQEPEKNVTSTRQLRPQRTHAAGIRECERRHHSHLSNGEERDEGERALPGEIGLARGH